MSKKPKNLNTSDELYLKNQQKLYSKATQLASQGAEFSDIVGLLNAEYALRLKIFVQQLPASVAEQTIYGRAVKAQIVKPKKK